MYRALRARALRSQLSGSPRHALATLCAHRAQPATSRCRGSASITHRLCVWSSRSEETLMPPRKGHSSPQLWHTVHNRLFRTTHNHQMVLFARVAPASRGRFFGEIAMSQALGCYAKKNVCVCGLCCDENQILGWRVWIKRLSVEPHCTYTQGFWGTVDTAGAGIFFQKCVRQNTHRLFG